MRRLECAFRLESVHVPFPFPWLLDDDVLVLEQDARRGGTDSGDEGVAGYDGAFPDDRIAAQDAGSRVDGDVVFDGRMAFGALELLSPRAARGRRGSRPGKS